MSRLVRSFALIVSAVVAFLICSIAPAHAEPTATCSTKVVDRTDAKELDVPRVRQAITNAESHGADIYVRAFQQVPGGSPDAYWKTSLKDCSNWSGTDGIEPKANIIMIIVGLDRQSAVFSGGANRTLEPAVNDIRTGMAPYFRTGDFTGGIVSALGQIESTMDPNRPIAQSGGGSGSGKTAVIVTVSIIGSLIALALLAFAGYTVTSRLSARKAAKIRRAKARLNAIKTHDETVRVVSRMDDTKKLNDEFMVASGDLPANLVDTHRETFERIKTAASSHAAAYADLFANPANDPTALNGSTEHYQELDEEYGRIKDGLTAAETDFAQLLKQLKKDRQDLSPQGQAQRHESLVDKTREYRNVLEHYSGAFNVASYQTTLGKITRDVSSVRSRIDSNGIDPKESHRKLTRLETQLQEFGRMIEELSGNATRLGNARQEITAAIQKARRNMESTTYYHPADEIVKLRRYENGIDRFIATKLKSSASLDQQVQELDSYLLKITSCVSSAKLKNDSKKREATARTRSNDGSSGSRSTSRRPGRSSSSDGGFGSGFGAGYAGGFGSSYGGGSSSSGSDYGSSGGSFGSSGGYSSSGGDFGSSGGW